ncbi:MAG: methyltransferase [Clostridia bacterium]|nr:methyltransferase [Clostridia bacterium]
MTDTIYEGERLDNVNENLRLIQKINGLTFGTDAYLLAAFIRPSKHSRAAELGSGTGIISLLCAARDKFDKIYAAEVQSEFADLCQRNADLNDLKEKIIPICADVRELRSENLGGELDAVFSNPPYMRTDSGKRNEHDAKFIARHEVCGGIGDFCAAAARLLRYGGIFYCVYRPDRMTDLFSALRENKLEPKRMTFVCADAETEPSMILVESKKGASTGLKFTPPLLLHTSDGDKSGNRTLTKEAERIYANCSFEEFER